MDEASLSGARRWWIYQRERFPIARYGVLVAAFSFSSVCMSRLVRGLPSWPSWPVAVTAFAGVFLFFLQLRFLDEFKDREADRQYRPERPVPRGLISLREIGGACALSALVQLALALWLHPALALLLLAAWVYMALMTVEFFAPGWLRPRLLPYMLTHMLIMPFIDLFATGCDWLTAGNSPPVGLLLFLAVSFLNGVVIELGRKTWAPAQERPGVDSYSGAWGLDRALCGVGATLFLSGACIAGVAWQVGFLAAALGLMGALLVWGLLLLVRFHRERTPDWAKKLENFTGIWVVVSYLILGVVPMGYAVWMR